MVFKVTIKWILPLKQIQITQQIRSIEQFWQKCTYYKNVLAQHCSSYVQKQTLPHIINIAYIKQGRVYYSLVGNNILSQTFNGTRKKRHSSSIDLQIQLFLWPKLEKQVKIQQINKNIFKINQEFDKLSKCMGQGYYNNLRMYYKKLENQKNDILNIKPLVKRNQNSEKYFEVSEEYNDQFIGIPKQQIKLNEHIQAIKEAHEGKNYGVNLFIERVFVSWPKVKALVDRIKFPKREEDKNIHLNIIQIYTELYEENNRLYVSLEDDRVIGLQDKSVTLNSLIAKLNEIGDKLYCIVLVGPKMRRLGLLRKEKKEQMEKKQLENKKREEKEKEKQLKREKEKEKNLQSDDKNLDGEFLMVPQMTALRRQRSFNEYIQRSNLAVQKQWYEETNKPVVVVSVFDPEKDIFLKKHFLPEFYTNVFKRYSVFQSLERAIVSINPSPNYKAESQKLLPFCCCVHEHDSNYNWNKIINRIGRSTAHKIFRHSTGEDYSKTFLKKQKYLLKNKKGQCPHELTRRQIYKYIMGEIPKQLDQPDCMFKCYESEKQTQLRVQLDLLIFNQSILNPDTEEKSQKNKMFWEAGEFKEENIIKAKKYQRQRLLTLFEIVNKIQRVFSFSVLIVTGYPKSGKSLFIELAMSYVVNRCDDYQLEQFENWHKLFHNGEIKKIKERILKTKQKQKTLILLFSKIRYDKKQDFELLIRKLSQMPEIKNSSILIIGSMGDNQQISKNSVIKQYKIQPIQHSLVKYLILKHQLTLFEKKKDVETYIDFLEGLKCQNSFEIYFSYLFNDLNLIKNDKDKWKVIIKKYQNKTQIILNSIKSDNYQLWQTIGFICSFSSDFFLCEFNKKLIIQNKNILQQLIKKKEIKGLDDSKIRLFRINFFENSQHNYKLQNSYLIHSESKCYQYFRKHSSYFFPRKSRYFIQFYYLFFSFLKRNTGTKLTEHCQRIIDEFGIFMFDFDEKLKEMENEIDKVVQMKENPEKQLKKMTQEQRSYLLERNLYLLIEFLKEISEKEKNELKKLEKELVEVSYIILLVSICRKSEGELVSCFKDELNCEIVKFIEANQFLIESDFKDEVIILFYQISALISYDLRLKVQKDETDEVESILDNLLVYEKSKIQIEKAKRLIEQNRSSKELEIEKMIKEIEKAENAIKTNLEEEVLSDLQQQNHCECLLDLLVEKILLSFNLFQSTGEEKQFKPKILKAQLDSLIKRVPQKSKNGPTIKVCEAYLKVRMNTHSNKDLDEKSLSVCYFPRKVVDLYQYVREKINPKALFESTNIALFMKAGCLKVGSHDYNYVRMDNIINKFLGHTMASRSLNVLFLNLSHKNFEMVSDQAPQILYFVLSVDCYEDKSKHLQVILEGNNLEAKEMKKEEFIAQIRKIKFKFLILFGSRSAELASEIEAKLHEEKKERAFVIISLTLNNKLYDLSTYPFVDDEQSPDVAKTAESFTRVENGQRAMQMTICCIIYLLAKDRHLKEVTKQQISQIVEKSIKISYRVVDDWCKKSLGKFAPKITSRVHFKDGLKMEFPDLGQGKLRNITCDMMAIRKNFQDDKYYENIGHTSEISEIFLKLSSNRVGTIIEISGNHNSGKTQILKQIGWYCFTRRIFQLGVMRFDVTELIKNETLESINLLINQQLGFEGNKSLLILLDNLQKDYMTSSENTNIFVEFFDSILLKKKPVSVVYTIRSDCVMDQSHKVVNQILNGYLGMYSEKPIFPIYLNKLQNVEKVCIMLINIRSPGNVDYNEIIKQNFEQISNLQIKKSPSKSLSLSMSFEHQKNKISLKHNKITRRVSQQHSLVKTSPYPFINRIKSTNHNKYSNPFEKLEVNYGPLKDMYEGISQEDEQSFCTKFSSKNRGISVQVDYESDLNEVLERCKQYMLKKNDKQEEDEVNSNEENKKNYALLEKQRQKQNYLTFDIKNITRLLSQLDGIRVLIHNQCYFPYIRD